MGIDLHAGICVRDHQAARDWYTTLFGMAPTLVASGTESVWGLAEHCSVYLKADPENAGHATLSVYVEDLDDTVASIRARGIAPESDETHAEGVRKVTFRDPDGNEFGFATRSTAEGAIA